MEVTPVDQAQALVVLPNGWNVAHLDATRIRFSAHQCIAFDGGPDDLRCLRLLADHLGTLEGLAVAIEGDGRLLRYVLEHFPGLRERIHCVVIENVPPDGGTEIEGLPAVLARELPAEVRNVFLCETRAYPRMRMRGWLGDYARIIDLDVLAELAPGELPVRAWVPYARDVIYPMDLPEIEFQAGLDVLVIDCPGRNLGLMPNGLGYVDNALKRVRVKHQTCDLDILIYHRFHIRRLFDEGGKARLAGGRELPTDPWQAEHYDLWSDPEVIAYFRPEVDEIVEKVVAARPKVLALSIHACNEKFSAAVVERVKQALPEAVVLVGGFSCYNPDIGLRAFPLADYMCIGEADLTVGPLAERLARGERPVNTPGVLSRFDPPGVPFLPAPMPHDLDRLDHPRYEWYDLNVYRNYNGYQLTPIIASRGCRWSRCTFCAERFYWRIRSPEPFVDEVEWLVSQGCRLFMFNESDLNGRPETLLAICDEVIRRGLKVKFTGQLRIHRKCDRAYFEKLHQAGFVALRFGVDAFSENALRLQKKGYTTATISQNLKDCWEAGIFTEVNWVIGVPGETDRDTEEGIELLLKNRAYIGRLANINPLILSTGSVYWMEPEKHNIHFRGDKEELYRNHPRAIPAHLWYSTEPYIDEKVRKERFEQIVLALHRAGFEVGAWARRIIEDVKNERDPSRGGPGQKPKLSAGVGAANKPPEQAKGAEAGAYQFRAGSALPEDRVHHFKSSLYVVSYQGQLYGIEPAAFEAAIGKGWAGQGGPRTIDVRGRFPVRFARTKNAPIELVESVGSYNVVGYDGLYYGLPQVLGDEAEREIYRQLLDHGFAPRPGLRGMLAGFVKWALVALGLRKPVPSPRPANSPVPWGEVDVSRLPGVITRASLVEAIAEVEKAQGLTRREEQPDEPAPRPRAFALQTIEPVAARPRLVGSMEGYNVVEYEGWFYGLPQALGEVKLDKVDVLEMPGVIRDLSRDVVEGEIRELTRAGAHG